MKKIISLLLSMTMLLSITAGLDLTAFASTYTGTCGDNVIWSLDTSTGELVISGTGDMEDYRASDRWYGSDENGQSLAPEYAPWQSYSFSSVIINEGVTSIGTGAFESALKLETVTIASTVTSIGYRAFGSCTLLSYVCFLGDTCDIDSNEYTFYNSITTTQILKNRITFYCSENSDAYQYAVEMGIDYCLPESECSHIAYYSTTKCAYYCKNCGSYMFINYGDTDYVCTEHDWDSGTVKTEPSCTQTGEIVYTCRVCSQTYSEPIEVTSHSYTSVVTAPTCTEQGYTTYTCVTCEYSYVDNYVSATGHSYDSNGQYCTVCGALNPDYVASADSTQDTSQDNTGTTNNNGSGASVSAGTDDTANNPATSNAITNASDTGTSTETSTTSVTKPKKTKIKKLTSPKKKQIKVTWKKVSGVTGYQVQYATNKKLTKNKKTVTVKGASKTSKTIKKLKSKKTYYVRVRTYKTVNGKKVYSNWSTVKKVKTK